MLPLSCHCSSFLAAQLPFFSRPPAPIYLLPPSLMSPPPATLDRLLNPSSFLSSSLSTTTQIIIMASLSNQENLDTKMSNMKERNGFFKKIGLKTCSLG